MLKVSIPKPCHEDWSAMVPTEQGRHCCSCAQTVVDFTQMNDDEVKYFLLNRDHERVCGRFNTDQLHRINISLPKNIFELKLPWWKHFLAASLVAYSMFLFSCNTTVTGEPIIGKIDLRSDSLPKPDRIRPTMGIIATPQKKDTITPKVCNTLTGEIAMLPQKDSTISEEVGIIEYIPEKTVLKKEDKPAIVGKLVATPLKKH